MNHAIPSYFGPSNELFGWFHVPEDGKARAGVVLVKPFGHEGIFITRAIRHQAERLVKAGFVVLRLDSHGTLNSAGNDFDSGRVSAWIDSIVEGARELRDQFGVTEIALFGTRLGATLAAFASERARSAGLPVSSLVLWAPVIKGKPYLRELRALHLMIGLEMPPPPEGFQEVSGFQLTAETVRDVQALELAAAIPPPHVLLLARDDGSAEKPVADEWARRGATVSIEAIAGIVDLQDPQQISIPFAVFDAAERWLSVRYPQAIALQNKDVHVREHRWKVGERELTEEALLVGDTERRFAILTRPVEALNKPAILLLNAGRLPQVGPNRMYVEFAREWAALGYAVLRMDIRGIGDSPAAPGGIENDTYPPTAEKDVYDALRTLSERFGVSSSIVAGLCSGAYHAFSAARVGLPVRGALLINPLTFYWRAGDSDAMPDAIAIREMEHYKTSVFQKDRWVKLLTGGVDLNRLRGVLLNRGKRLAASYGRRAVARVRPGGTGALASDLLRVSREGIDVSIFFATGDPGELIVQDNVVPRDRVRLGKTQRFLIDAIDGADHTFTPVHTQVTLRKRLTDYLESRFP